MTYFERFFKIPAAFTSIYDAPLAVLLALHFLVHQGFVVVSHFIGMTNMSYHAIPICTRLTNLSCFPWIQNLSDHSTRGKIRCSSVQ